MKPLPTLPLSIAAALAIGAKAAPLQFRSTDPAVDSTFLWARQTALSYAHSSPSDTVGPWFEAALPGRESFCIRDLAHQLPAALALGLEPHTKNMLLQFAKNISPSKDWCTYWEITRHGRPTPCDYASDTEFWYNLPANFDIVRSTLAAFQWTGDSAYITNPALTAFAHATFTHYLNRWDLTPNRIMNRPRFMNVPPAQFNPKNAFHTCRGLPSYAENISAINVAADLVGAAAVAAEAHSHLLTLAAPTQSHTQAHQALALSQAYLAILHNQWWDPLANRFNTHRTTTGTFHRGEGIPYLLLIGAIRHPHRIQAAINDILSRPWNVENLSAFPYILYLHGHPTQARAILTSLPSKPRSSYPEVAFGIIDGIVRGLMGINPTFSTSSLATCHNAPAPQSSTLGPLPLFGGTITLTHTGHQASTLTNSTPVPITWHPSFRTPSGQTIAAPPITLPPGTQATATTPTPSHP